MILIIVLSLLKSLSKKAKVEPLGKGQLFTTTRQKQELKPVAKMP